MKRTLLCSILSIVLCCNLAAQLSDDLVQNTPKGMDMEVQKNSNKLFFLATESFPLPAKGNLFLNEKFENATIIDFENEVLEVKLRYRVVDDEMQINHLDKIKALYPQKVKQLIFTKNEVEQIFIPSEYSEKKVTHLGYFELLSSGKLMLLKKYKRNGKSVIKTSFLFKKDGQPAECLKVKKSVILKMMSSHKSEVSKFMVKEKINLKKEKDLKKVFDFYNSLL